MKYRVLVSRAVHEYTEIVVEAADYAAAEVAVQEQIAHGNFQTAAGWEGSDPFEPSDFGHLRVIDVKDAEEE